MEPTTPRKNKDDDQDDDDSDDDGDDDENDNNTRALTEMTPRTGHYVSRMPSVENS